jgi:tRNA A37 threonylcarbamoyladenosine modification protein TsaB
VRICLAAVKGIALGAKVPLIGVSAFQVVAVQAGEDGLESEQIVVVLDAKRGQVYLQCFDKVFSPLNEAGLYSYEEAEKIVNELPSVSVVGQGGNLLESLDKKSVPKKTYLSLNSDGKTVALASDKIIHNQMVGCDVAAFYIRSPDAKKPKVTPLAQKN